MCYMTHSYVWHLYSATSYECHDSSIFEPWLIHMCDMTHSYVCHDSFICVPWLIHVCHDLFICVTCLPPQRQKQHHLYSATSNTDTHPRFPHLCVCACHVCDMTHPYVCLDVSCVCGVSICVYWCVSSSATSNTDSWTICSRTCVCGCHVSSVRLCDVCHARVMYVTRLIHVCFSWWVLQHCILDGYCSTVF